MGRKYTVQFFGPAKIQDTTVETYDKKSYDKKSRLSIFDLWTLELNNFDLKIGFLVQSCIYSQPTSKKFPNSRTAKCNFLFYVSTVVKTLWRFVLPPSFLHSYPECDFLMALRPRCFGPSPSSTPLFDTGRQSVGSWENYYGKSCPEIWRSMYPSPLISR